MDSQQQQQQQQQAATTTTATASRAGDDGPYRRRRSPSLSQTSSEQSDEGDLTRLVAQIKAAAAKKVKGRKKELLRTIESRIAVEEKKYEAEAQRHAETLAQAGDEWTRALALSEAKQDDVLGQLLTLEQQLADVQLEIQRQFLRYASDRVREGVRVRDRMRASTAGADNNDDDDDDDDDEEPDEPAAAEGDAKGVRTN